MSRIVDNLRQFEYPPRFGPEWGSGGIFALKYHRGVLYFTLAFEAEAHFARKDGEKIYRFDLLGKGPGPRSGGDTYNAVEAVDDEIYFGGWVHAPAVYEGRIGKGGRILFNNKFSHIHAYDVEEDKVRLLWSDTIEHGTEWAGEISEILYDPLGDRLIVGRADGHRNLGIYSVDRRDGKAKPISDLPALKGTHHLDYVCFDVQKDWRKGAEAIQTIDLVTGRRIITDISYGEASVDGGGVRWPAPGCATSAYSRLFFFVRGGVLVGDPLADLEPLSFVRLFDFGLSGYSPSRTMAKPIAGGVLVAFNAYTHGMLHPRDEFEKKMLEANNFINGPSILLYITPPAARIVAALGARVTSFEKVGETLLVAASTGANLAADDATPMDVGFRDISAVSVDNLLTSKPPPVAFVILGRHVEDKAWGGIPLYGYRESILVVNSNQENKLTIYEYDFNLPAGRAESEVYSLKQGRQVLNLSSHRGIISFKFEQTDPEAKIRMYLE